MDTRCETISGVPIVGYCRVKDTDIFLPMIETDTDIQWVEGCIKSREEHPEYYPDAVAGERTSPPKADKRQACFNRP